MRERGEMVAHRMKAQLAGAQIDCLMHCVLRDARKAVALQPFLQTRRVDVLDGTGQGGTLRVRARQRHSHERGAEHEVIGKAIGNGGSLAQKCRDIGEIGHSPALRRAFLRALRVALCASAKIEIEDNGSFGELLDNITDVSACALLPLREKVAFASANDG
jgi:hypothetical protein